MRTYITHPTSGKIAGKGEETGANAMKSGEKMRKKGQKIASFSDFSPDRIPQSVHKNPRYRNLKRKKYNFFY